MVDEDITYILSDGKGSITAHPEVIHHFRIQAAAHDMTLEQWWAYWLAGRKEIERDMFWFDIRRKFSRDLDQLIQLFMRALFPHV